jgi:hypothetical protein
MKVVKKSHQWSTDLTSAMAADLDGEELAGVGSFGDDHPLGRRGRAPRRPVAVPAD